LASQRISLLERPLLHESLGQTNDFCRLQIQSEMSSIEDVYFGARIVSAIRFAAGDLSALAVRKRRGDKA
jgi:hypothetical protein